MPDTCALSVAPEGRGRGGGHTVGQRSEVSWSPGGVARPTHLDRHFCLLDLRPPLPPPFHCSLLFPPRHQRTRGGGEEADRLEDVKPHLLAAVLDTVATPANLTRDLVGDFGLLLLGLAQSEAFLCDEKLERIRIRALGVAVVQDLVQQLVNQRKVVFDVDVRKLGEREGG